MSLFISHSLFGVGKIQGIKGNRVDVHFPESSDAQFRQFTLEALSSSVRRHVLNQGTPCIVKHQHFIVDCLLCAGEGSKPHQYRLLREDGKSIEVLETDIELPIIKDEFDKASFGEIRPGVIVSANDRHGFGKVLAIDGDECDVAFFHHPGVQDIRHYPLNRLEHAILSPETRVFIQREGGWFVGRVVDCISGSKLLYSVRFPNKVERNLFEDELHVRCLSARHSPAEVMAQRGMETQFFHDPRAAFVRMLTKLRNRSQGLSGVLSSSVELVGHQIRAAQKVLTDPVQRYVLADEVGLGKTIEAGFVIRQTMLDLPQCHVGVLVPSSLVKQWEQELYQKFRVVNFSNPPMVLPYSKAHLLTEYNLEMLVVDEAHNIFSPQGTDDTIIRLCLQSRRLLLLSATPVIGYEHTFLNMLKVLDPDVFATMDMETFRQKVERRQEFGALARMLGNMETMPPLTMVGNIARRLLSTDDMGMVLLENLIQAEDRDAQNWARGALYHHIVESHRIFHRLIRNRRKDITDNAFLPRSFDKDTSHVLVITDENPATMELAGLFEEWRQAAHDRLQEIPEKSENHIAMALDCAKLFEAVGAGTFGKELEQMIRLNSPGGQVEGSGILATAALQAQGSIPISVEVLRRAVEAAQKAHKAQNPLFQGPVDIVVFISEPTLCRDIEESFISPPGVRIEYHNRLGEEGKNLQHAQVLLHMDIPLDPVRMEQRIGRLDRFNRKARSLLHVCCCPGEEEPSNPWLAWLTTLISGFRIFNEPISDVQFLLENERIVLAEALLLQGVAGINSYRETLSDRLTKERNSLDEQYEFDQQTPTSYSEADWLEALQDVDCDEETMSRGLDGLLVHAFKMPVRREDNVRSYRWRNSTLIPAIPWKKVFSQGLEQMSTFSRVKAMCDPQVSLLRLGHPLVDALERFCRWDIRGIAFATWRTCDDLLLEEPWVGFKLDFVIEGDLREWENDIRLTSELASARRRTDSLLPPWVETYFLDFHLNPVTDERFLDHLRRPYRSRPGCDYNLQNRPEALSSVIDESTLARLAYKVAETGEVMVREGSYFQSVTKVVQIRAQTELDRRLRRLRAHILNPSSDMKICHEEAFEKRIAKAVMEPSVRLDSIGLFVLAPDKPMDS
jgi:ATP-dependent helicase HepA